MEERFVIRQFTTGFYYRENGVKYPNFNSYSVVDTKHFTTYPEAVEAINKLRAFSLFGVYNIEKIYII